jgi:excisionase family DNA binding protein
MQDQSTQRDAELPELLTLKEAADFLHCHPNTLRNWDKKGILVAERLGSRGDRRFRKSDILALLKKGKN